ncbi:hypothetical protein [Aeromonas caviae]|uniref:hypothetical protein n=1 Tax=Aeromonas caviae TaxID=648 RepID=UPI0038D0471C
MTHEAEQERMAAHRREWDKQSIYLRLQEGIPAAFWVWGDLVAPLEPCLTQGDQGASFGWGGGPTRPAWRFPMPSSPGW